MSVPFEKLENTENNFRLDIQNCANKCQYGTINVSIQEPCIPNLYSNTNSIRLTIDHQITTGVFLNWRSEIDKSKRLCQKLFLNKYYLVCLLNRSQGQFEKY